MATNGATDLEAGPEAGWLGYYSLDKAGRLGGGESLEALIKLGRQVARQTGKEEEETVRQLRQRVAVLLVRDNVAMFDSRSPSYPQSLLDADADFDVLP